MPIERKVNADGSWTETANDPKSVQELREKHDPGLQKRGADDFHKKWLANDKIGWEKVTDAHGNATHVRADEADKMIANGTYSPMNRPRSVMPALPWKKKPQTPGRHKYKYDPVSRSMVEVL